MKPIEVRLQNAYAGNGVEKDPVVCWEYDSNQGSHTQRSCRIQIYCGGKRDYDNCIYDSGILKTKMQNNHKCGCILQSHKQYKVVVQVEDEDGRWEKGESAAFFSGIVSDEDWKAKWISNGTAKPHYLGREFFLDKKIISAVISVAGVGQYVLTVNGKQPDSSVLNGSWTDYNKHIHYRTYEITSLLGNRNEVRIEVGNGWYHADMEDTRHFYTKNMGYQYFGGCLAAIASLTILFEDGEEMNMGTDGSWWWQESETTYANIYGSEDYDARKEEREEKLPCRELGKSDRPQGKLIPALYPPVKISRSYQAVFVKELEDGSRLFDLGQNMSGLFEIRVRGKRGTKIRIFPTEKLDIHGNPWESMDSWCCYTLKGEGVESWKQKFTYCAGRYIRIMVDIESEVKEYPEICGIAGYFITSAARDTGKFYCSDYRYMQIHDLVLRAVESNLNHLHTDCPTIERLGWQEPNHLMAPSIFYTKEAECLWEKISMDQRDGQYEETQQDIDLGAFPHKYGSGLLPSIAPAYAKFLHDGGEGSFWDIVPWGSSIILGAFEVYRFTGNTELLMRNYDTSKRYVDYLYKKYLAYPDIYNKPPHLHFLCHGLGDWGIQQNRGEARENIETAYLYHDMKILAKVAKWMGKDEDEREYIQKAEEILAEYNKELLVWNPQTGEWAYDAYDRTGITPTQAVQAIPLQFGMVPKEKRDSVVRSFLLSCGEERLETGEIGLPYILRTLGELGESDLVQKMIFQKRHPSYYRFIEKGETTLPEFWRDDARSRNHDMMGAVLEWMYRYMAGIQSEDGFRNITINPVLPEGVDFLQCSYKSVMGTIEVTVQKKPQMQIEVCIPVNTKGRVKAGETWIPIQGGNIYKLSVRSGGKYDISI